VQATFFGTPANGAFSWASRLHAAARRGSVPPTGLQRRVYDVARSAFSSGRIVMCSEVDASSTAARTFTAPG